VVVVVGYLLSTVIVLQIVIGQNCCVIILYDFSCSISWCGLICSPISWVDSVFASLYIVLDYYSWLKLLWTIDCVEQIINILVEF
jgi:hypothetical protein